MELIHYSKSRHLRGFVAPKRWRSGRMAIYALLAASLLPVSSAVGAAPEPASTPEKQATAPGKNTPEKPAPKPDGSSPDKPASGKAPAEDKAATSTKNAPGDQASEAAETSSKPDSGIKFELKEQNEGWGNLVGGAKRGTAYSGLTAGSVDVDLEKAIGWQRARFFVSAYDIRGHGPSRSLVGNNQLVSSLEATPSVELYDLWLEQRLPGRISIRLGQEGANDELMISAHAALYLNSSFGFPPLAAADLPSGAPNYPLATPFARIRWRASDQWSLVGAVFNGDPAPPGIGDPQIRDRNGTAFRLDDHTLAFAEARYAADLDAPDKLQTNYKFGMWYHTGRFADQRFDNAGGLLASPATSGVPWRHSSDFAVYGVVDQILWHREGTKDQGIGVFLQIQGAPGDRNLVDWFVAAGVNWNGPFDSRPDDVAGLAFSYLGISPAARRFSRDLVAFGGAASAYASNETIIEATYQAPVTKWLTLQPDAQLVLNPNAGIPNASGRIPRSPAFVIGLRATIKLSNAD